MAVAGLAVGAVKRSHVAAGLVTAVPASVLSGFVVYLMGAPEWAPWLTLMATYIVWAMCFLIIIEALTEGAPIEPVETPAVLDSPAIERRSFKPMPHYEAKPAELFAGIINVEDATVVYSRDYQGKRRAVTK
jgi:hypothetical protein